MTPLTVRRSSVCYHVSPPARRLKYLQIYFDFVAISKGFRRICKDPTQESQMKLETLEELYIDELKDLWSAEKQILQALPKMIRAVEHKELKRAFKTHERQTRQHVKRLERVCRKLGVSPRGKKCEGMEGLLKEGSGLIGERPDQDVLDAGLLSAAQHVEHYEMAGYGTVRTWARLLGRKDEAAILQQTLNEEGETDHLLTKLANRLINIDADKEAEDK